MKILNFVIILLFLNILCCSEGDPKPDIIANDSDSNAIDSSLDSSNSDSSEDTSKDDSDISGDSETDTWPMFDDPEVDDDKDGYTNEEGDCADYEKFIGPQALEDLGEDGKGDGIDNDCDGLTDTDDIEICDTDIGASIGKESADLARAMNLCDDRFLISSEKTHSATNNSDLGYETMRFMGTVSDCLKPRHGKFMTYLGTGAYNAGNSNDREGIDGDLGVGPDPIPEYSGDAKNTTSTDTVCDNTKFKVSLKAPVNAYGFTFDFLFASAEYPEFVGETWNDTFYAIMEYKSLNSGATTNLSFDSNGNEIEVNANFFENASSECSEQGSSWDNSYSGGAGSTGWLRTSWELEKPGDSFELTFSIHDEGEDGTVACGWDSMVLLDNFQWITEDVDIPRITIPVDID